MKRLGLLSAALLMIAATGAVTAAAQTETSTGPVGTHYTIGKPYQFDGTWYRPVVNYAYDESGVASVYPANSGGFKTTSGEMFDDTAVTGAHKTLPLPSIVRVINLDNGLTIEVRINDRGPFVDNQLIQLTHKAAKVLGIPAGATAHVRVQIIADKSRALAAALAGTETVPNASSAPAPTVNVTALPLGTTPIQPLNPVASPTPVPSEPAPAPMTTTATPVVAPAPPAATFATTTATVTATQAPAPATPVPAAAAPVPAPAKSTPVVATPATATPAPTIAMPVPVAMPTPAPAPIPPPPPAPSTSASMQPTAVAAAKAPQPAAPAATIDMNLVEPAPTPSPVQPAAPSVASTQQASGSTAAVSVSNGSDAPTGAVAINPPPESTPAKPAPVAALPVDETPPTATAAVAPAKQIPVELPAHFFIQTGAFKGTSEANRLRTQLAGMGETKIVPTRLGDEEYNAVLLGPIPSMATAQGYLKQIIAMGHPDAVLIIQ